METQISDVEKKSKRDAFRRFSVAIGLFWAFLGLREAPRGRGWVRLGVLAQARPWIDPGVDF